MNNSDNVNIPVAYNGYQSNNYGSVPVFVPPKKEKRFHNITKGDIAGIVLSFIFTFVLFQIGIFNGLNFGFSVSVILLYTMAYIYVRNGERKNTVFSVILYLLSIILMVSFSFTGDGLIKLISFIFLLFSSSFSLNCISGNINVKGSTYLLLIDSVLVSEKCVFSRFSVMKNSFEKHIKLMKSKALVNCGLGLLCAVPVVCVVMLLLSSSDVAFESLVKLIFANVFTFIFAIGLSIILTPVIFSHFFALKKGEGLSDKPVKCIKKKIPASTVNTFLVMISVVYCAYLVSQLAYITKAFSFLLPDGYSASEFARSGFFQMGVIAFINLMILISTALFVKRSNTKLPVASKMLLSFLCLFTEFYIFTAFIKMVQYISIYGLTRLRVLTSVFMIMLALIFFVLLIRLYIHKIPYAKLITLICTLTVILISVVDINTVIAEYNYNAYSSDMIDTIDVDQLDSLGISALPTLIKLADNKDPDIAFEAQTCIVKLADEIYNKPFDEAFDEYESSSERATKNEIFEMNLSWIRAKEALDDFMKNNPDFYNEYQAMAEARNPDIEAEEEI